MFIFLVVALIKSIHSVKCKKVEREMQIAQCWTSPQTKPP